MSGPRVVTRQEALADLGIPESEITLGLEQEDKLSEAEKIAQQTKLTTAGAKILSDFCNTNDSVDECTARQTELNTALDFFKVGPLMTPANFPADPFASPEPIEPIEITILPYDHPPPRNDENKDDDAPLFLSAVDAVEESNSPAPLVLLDPTKSLPTMAAVLPNRPADSKPDPVADRDELDPDIYSKLYEHYKAWSWLAQGSWGELEHQVPQIEKNCFAIQEKLLEDKFKSQHRFQQIQGKYKDLQSELHSFLSVGPAKTYLFCKEHYTDPCGTSVDERLTQLNTLYPKSIKSALNVGDATVCFVEGGQHRSAFVQGLRTSDNTFISEAHLSPKLNTDTDKLREFVFSQVESFHADPRNVGSVISFQGNYSPQFLALAIHYCNLRDYAWQVDPTLQSHVLGKCYQNEEKSFQNLFANTHDDDAEKSWDSWLKANHKKPFNEMLDKETVKNYEARLALRPMIPREVTAARSMAVELAKNLPSILWERHEGTVALPSPSPSPLTAPSTPAPASPSASPSPSPQPSRTKIASNPQRFNSGVTIRANDSKLELKSDSVERKDDDKETKKENAVKNNGKVEIENVEEDALENLGGVSLARPLRP